MVKITGLVNLVKLGNKPRQPVRQAVLFLLGDIILIYIHTQTHTNSVVSVYVGVT